MSNTTLLFRTHGTLVGRILIGGFFLLAGLNKLMGEAGVAGTAGYIESVGLPVPALLAWIALLIEIIFGLALIVGKKTSKAALGLAIFVILVSFIFHGPQLWADNAAQQMSFMKNIAILGGLLYLIAYGPGDGWHLAGKSTSSAEAPQANNQPTSSL